MGERGKKREEREEDRRQERGGEKESRTPEGRGWAVDPYVAPTRWRLALCSTVGGPGLVWEPRHPYDFNSVTLICVTPKCPSSPQTQLQATG